MKDRNPGMAQIEDVRQIEDEKFSAEIKQLVKNAEDTRLAKSRQYTSRQRTYYITATLLVIGSTTGLIWILLMGGSIPLAVIALVVSVIISLALGPWAKRPLQQYHAEFKTSFMPALARALGNLSFHPTSGIGMKLVAPAGILPSHGEYKAEDSFKGKFKGVGLIVSEARLFSKKKKGQLVFDGVFVLLNIPENKFQGHTIITSDHEAIKRWGKTRWKKLQPVAVADGIKAGDFRVFSTKPEEAMQLADMDLMDLLQKLSKVFDQALMSVAFYARRRVFLAIPYEDDMFEPGNIFIPVSGQSHALKCKKEIEQILYIVDVLDVYEPGSFPESKEAAPDSGQPTE